MMSHDEASELLAVLALDAVEGDEHERIEAHLAECPRCRAELDAHREVAAALGNSVESLPDGLWDSIARRLPPRQDDVPPPMPQLLSEGIAAGGSETSRFRTPPTTTSSGPRSRRRPRSARGRMLTIASAAVAAAAVFVVLGLNLAHDNDQITQLQGTHSAVVAALHTSGHKVVNVEDAAHRRLAEFVVVNGKRSISLGLLGRSPHQATFTSTGARSPTTLAITVEPAGGSVYPSGPMLGTGTA
jgi:anti-sigma factor RsiW